MRPASMRPTSALPPRRERMAGRAAAYADQGYRVLRWTRFSSVLLGKPRTERPGFSHELHERLDSRGRVPDPVDSLSRAEDDLEWNSIPWWIAGSNGLLMYIIPNPLVHWRRYLFVGAVAGAACAWRSFNGLLLSPLWIVSSVMGAFALLLMLTVAFAIARAIAVQVLEGVLYERMELVMDQAGVIHEVPLG